MVKVKALSINPYYANAIFFEQKTVECRTWKINYRGDLLICSTAKKLKGTIPGHALCVVTLADIVPFKKQHLKPALMHKSEYQPGMYAWLLENVRTIKPFAIKGKLGLWECKQDIEFIDDISMSEQELDNLWKTTFEPLYI